MEFIEEAEAQARLNEILDDAQRRPIIIRREGTEIAVMLSLASYERLRAAAVQGFLKFGTRSPAKPPTPDSQRNA